MKLDFLIPGNPNEGFISQIAFFRIALDSLGGIYKKARLVAVFGDETINQIPDRWVPYYRRIDIEWVPLAEYRQFEYPAQADWRHEVIRKDAHLAIFCDADTVLMRPLGFLLWRLRLLPTIAGVVAHYHFPWDKTSNNPEKDWQDIASEILQKKIDLPYRYTLLPPENAAPTPFYVNYGFFAGTPKLLAAFYARYKEIVPRVYETLGNWFCCQVAIALTCVDLDLPTKALPMRFNFPNDSLADQMYPDEASRIVLLHYLRTEQFDRQKIFSSHDHFKHFLSLDLEGSNRTFQEFVLRITGGTYPFS